MKSIQWTILAAALALAGTDAMAVPLSGTLIWSSPNGSSPIFANPATGDSKCWDNAATSISWNIVAGASSYTYSYTWRTASGAKGLSHIILEISPNAEADDFWNFSGDYSTFEIKGYTTSDPSNQGLPSNLNGIKFNAGSGSIVTENGIQYKEYTYSFESQRVPVFGDFYARDGKDGGNDVYAYNAGFTINDQDIDQAIHIVVPDTVINPNPNPNPNPTPDAGTTVSLIGLALLGIEGIRRRLS